MIVFKSLLLTELPGSEDPLIQDLIDKVGSGTVGSPQSYSEHVDLSAICRSPLSSWLVPPSQQQMRRSSVGQTCSL